MTLVSPGVETQLIDESLFVPNAASLVPLFFVATQDEKIRANGEPADGTFEHSVIRSITSLRQSINFYGEPRFLSDGAGNQHHGDARNEYGLFALNQYLGIGNGAHVVRANVNLNDNIDDTQDQWDQKVSDATTVIQNVVQNYINNVNLSNGLPAGTTQSVLANLSTLIPWGSQQTHAEFNGAAPYGSGIFDVAAVGVAVNYAVGDQITMENGMVVRIDSVDLHAGQTGLGEPTTFTVLAAGNDSFLDDLASTPVEVNVGTVLGAGVALPGSPVAGEKAIVVVDAGNNVVTNRSGFLLTLDVANLTTFMQTNYDFATFTGGTGYIAGEVITLANGATVEVVQVAAGVVTHFALKTPGSFIGAGVIGQAGTTTGGTPGFPGTGFDLTITAANLVVLKTEVNATEIRTLVKDATGFIFDPVTGVYAFRNMEDDFYDDKTAMAALPYDVFPNGFDQGAVGTFNGFDGAVEVDEGAFATSGTTIADWMWTPQAAADLFAAEATKFKFTQVFLTKSSLGNNDAARRVSIVSALQSAIVSNTDVRSESFQFNVVACPGYPEVVDELLALSADQKDEVFVAADTPGNLTPDGVTNPTNGWAATTARQTSTNVAYYYPWTLASNLDGANVLAAPSGIAIRQMAYNDNISYLWFAPAGTTRGLITGVTDVGYADGVIGGPTNFVPVALNQGQRDALYQDVPSGKINPITFQPGKGIAIMGQKTSSPTTSALDRINVVRLVMHVRRQLRLTTVGFLFEPNDQRTRDNVKALADNFLSTILTNRGIVDFLTVCDDSNNTADVVDRSELILDVLIKPTKAVEFITIPIRITTQGAEF